MTSEALVRGGIAEKGTGLMDLSPRFASRRLLAVKLMRALRVNKVAHHVYYRHLHGFDTANKYVLPALERCFERLGEPGSPISGDYMEFGVFKGYSFWYAQQVARRLNLRSMRFFGFDSFAGLPEPRGIDITADQHFYKGQFACSKAVVERNLDAKGVDWDRTFLIEGFFSESLTAKTRRKYGMKRVALALIDCDLYESTVQVLEFLEPMLDDGTVVLFDDWNAFDASDARGQRRALCEFLRIGRWAAEPLLAYGHYGQVFVMRRERPTHRASQNHGRHGRAASEPFQSSQPQQTLWTRLPANWHTLRKKAAV